MNIKLKLCSHAGYKTGDDSKRGYKIIEPPHKDGLKIPKEIVLKAAEGVFSDINVIENYIYGNQKFTLICLPKSVKITTIDKRFQLLIKITNLILQMKIS